MKKIYFSMVPALMILLSGCNGSSYGLLRSAGIGDAMVNPPLPLPLKSKDDRGICLSISTRSSLRIDVECILDYVQGASEFGLKEPYMNPWIRWDVSF